MKQQHRDDWTQSFQSCFTMQCLQLCGEPVTHSQESVDLLALVNDGAELGDEESSQLDQFRPLLWT